MIRNGLIATLIALLGAVVDVQARVVLEFVPAHWVDEGDALRPRSPLHVFAFNALAFTSPDDGWIVGERFALRVKGDALEVSFIGAGDGWLTNVAVAADGSVWTGGFGDQSDQIISNRTGRWRDEPIAGLVGPDFVVSALLPFAGDRLIAALRPSGGSWDSAQPLGPTQFLEFAGGRWRRVLLPPEARSEWHLAANCRPADGPAWVVGFELLDPKTVRPLVLRSDGVSWTAVATPLADRQAQMSDVMCAPDGRLVAGVSILGGGTRTAHLLRYDGTWQTIALPHPFDRGSVAGPSGSGAEDFWLAASTGYRRDGDCHPRLLHYRAGEWQVEDAPPLPGERRCYSLADIYVGADGRGWAIGSTDGGGQLRGVILRRRDGVWKVANWDWHFWDRPLSSILFD